MIRVNGAGSRRELLGIIREHFERIHKTYEKLPVTEIVPIPGFPSAQVKHELLLKYERAGREDIAVDLGDALRDFKVKDLLDGIDLPGMTRWVPFSFKNGYDLDTIASVLPQPTRSQEQLKQWSQPTLVFVSYSRKDNALLDQLRAALVPYERIGTLHIWADMLTEPGEKWESEIVDHLDNAQIVILLLSNDFLSSSYCMDVEFPRVRVREKKGECTIVPIVVRACRYDLLKIGEIQAIVPGGKPVDEHEKPDRAWHEVTKELDRVIETRKKAR